MIRKCIVLYQYGNYAILYTVKFTEKEKAKFLTVTIYFVSLS
jgi:hypothetical protein